MQTVYYSLMRNFLAFLVIGLAASSLSAQDANSDAAPAKPTAGLHAAISDSHEGVTIGIEPWTQASRYKEKFPKKSPFTKGIVAIHVSFRNDNDHGLKVNLQSIRLLVQLDEENRQELVPLSAEDVADAVILKDNGKDPTAKRSSAANTAAEYQGVARYELDGVARCLPERGRADERGGGAQHGGRTDLL